MALEVIGLSELLGRCGAGPAVKHLKGCGERHISEAVGASVLHGGTFGLQRSGG